MVTLTWLIAQWLVASLVIGGGGLALHAVAAHGGIHDGPVVTALFIFVVTVSFLFAQAVALAPLR